LGGRPVMPRHAFSVTFLESLAMLSVAMILLWVQVIGGWVKQASADAALTVTGYLRPRPDPALEDTLRTALADLDQELAAVLGDRTPREVLDR
jgi:hypothetical protein